MIPQINILASVDVIGALNDGTLANNLYMVGNRRDPRDTGLGTDHLTTNVTFTQVINWHVIGIDFQTDVQIERITFYRNGSPITAANTPCARLGKYGAPSGHYWAGVVNYPTLIEGGAYQYLIEFNMGRRKMVMPNFANLIVSA